MVNKLRIYDLYVESFIKFTDIDNKSISNDKAKLILGKMWRVPSHCQTMVLNDIIRCKLLGRVNQKILEIRASS